MKKIKREKGGTKRALVSRERKKTPKTALNCSPIAAAPSAFICKWPSGKGRVVSYTPAGASGASLGRRAAGLRKASEVIRLLLRRRRRRRIMRSAQPYSFSFFLLPLRACPHASAAMRTCRDRDDKTSASIHRRELARGSPRGSVHGATTTGKV